MDDLTTTAQMDSTWFSPPTQEPPVTPPFVVTLTTASVPVPTLMDMRRDLISALQTVENLLGLPPDKRAIRTRAERRSIIAGEGEEK